MANAYANNQIGLINMCLLSIGEAPLPDTFDPTTLEAGTDAAIARDLVEKVSRQVQDQGWWFNTDYNYLMERDVNNEIIIDSTTVLRLDFSAINSDTAFTIRTGTVSNVQSTKVYDLFEHTTVLTQDVMADIIYLVPYADLPTMAYDLIGYRAANKFQKQVLGATDLSQTNMLEEIDAQVQMDRNQLQYINRNLMSPRVSYRYTNPSRGWRGA